MTYVVTEPCINCKHTSCVEVCPVEAFREGLNFLVIDPDECIDCSVCVPACPAEAIFEGKAVPRDQQDFIALNARLARKWPVITECKPALHDASRGPMLAARRDLLIE